MRVAPNQCHISPPGHFGVRVDLSARVPQLHLCHVLVPLWYCAVAPIRGWPLIVHPHFCNIAGAPGVKYLPAMATRIFKVLRRRRIGFGADLRRSIHRWRAILQPQRPIFGKGNL